jgi:hypothetical protein
MDDRQGMERLDSKAIRALPYIFSDETVELVFSNLIHKSKSSPVSHRRARDLSPQILSRSNVTIRCWQGGRESS